MKRHRRRTSFLDMSNIKFRLLVKKKKKDKISKETTVVSVFNFATSSIERQSEGVAKMKIAAVSIGFPKLHISVNDLMEYLINCSE